jgi:hypothetical protein
VREIESARAVIGYARARARARFKFELENFQIQKLETHPMFYCFVFYAFTASTRAVPNDARGMVQTNSVEFPFSVHGGRRAQEVASENVLSPYVVNGKYFKCVFAFVGAFLFVLSMKSSAP